LFPIINFITSFIEEPDLTTESDLISRANEDIDSLTNKKAIVDGNELRDLERYRVQSGIFELEYPNNNVFGFQSGTTKAISDGYWLFLKPLCQGLHEIYVSGSCYSGKTSESIRWRLDVQE
jgi:hypothetical protein